MQFFSISISRYASVALILLPALILATGVKSPSGISIREKSYLMISDEGVPFASTATAIAVFSRITSTAVSKVLLT